MRRPTPNQLRALVSGSGLALLALTLVVSGYVVPPPDAQTDLGLASLDVQGLHIGTVGPSELRADVQVDVDMSVAAWHPRSALRNLRCDQSVTVTAVFSGSAQGWREAGLGPGERQTLAPQP